MSPVYQHDDVVAYKVVRGSDVTTVCADCLENTDNIKVVYSEDQRDHDDLLIICDCCNEKC